MCVVYDRRDIQEVLECTLRKIRCVVKEDQRNRGLKMIKVSESDHDKMKSSTRENTQL